MTVEELERVVQGLQERVKRLEQMEKRVQAMEDAEEIRTLQANYVYWLSEREWAKVVECFSEDGSAEIELSPKHEGKDALEAFFKRLTTDYEAFQEGGRILSQPVISVHGDKAKGNWAMAQFRFYFRTSTESISLFGPGLQGKYDVDYVKENGKWKFARLKFTRPWPEDQVYGKLPPGGKAAVREQGRG